VVIMRDVFFCNVALVRKDVSEEPIGPTIRVNTNNVRFAY
jgi:hypothetical protein